MTHDRWISAMQKQRDPAKPQHYANKSMRICGKVDAILTKQDAAIKMAYLLVAQAASRAFPFKT